MVTFLEGKNEVEITGRGFVLDRFDLEFRMLDCKLWEYLCLINGEEKEVLKFYTKKTGEKFGDHNGLHGLKFQIKTNDSLWIFVWVDKDIQDRKKYEIAMHEAGHALFTIYFETGGIDSDDEELFLWYQNNLAEQILGYVDN